MASQARASADDLVIGLLYIVIAFLCILAYIPCLVVMFRDPDVRFKSCYRLMFHYGLADMIQLIGHGLAGFIIMSKLVIPYWTSKVFGGIVNMGWMAYMMFSVVLAINRGVLVSQNENHWSQMLFKTPATFLWILICWGVGCGFLAAYLSPYVTFKLFPEKYAFYYDLNSTHSEDVKQFGLYLNTTQVIFVGCCYVAILVFVRMKKDTVMSGEEENRNKSERSLMIQVSLIFLYTLFFEVTWDLSPYFLPNDKFTFAFINILWIFNGGINPIIYITLNRTIQNKVLGCLLSVEDD